MPDNTINRAGQQPNVTQFDQGVQSTSVQKSTTVQPALTVEKVAGEITSAANNVTDGNGVALPKVQVAKSSDSTNGPDLTVNEDTSGKTSSVLANDKESIKSFDSTSANGGTIKSNGDGTFTYTPAANFHGNDSFNYSITDKDGKTKTGTISVQVDSVNDGPTASGDKATTIQGDPVKIDVLANDSDVEGDSLSVGSYDSKSAKGGSITKNKDGTLNYTPAAGFSGTDTFTYTVEDGNGGSTSATVTVTVDPFSVTNARTGINDIGAAISAAVSNFSEAKSDLAQAQLSLKQVGDEAGGEPRVQVEVKAGEAHVVNKPSKSDMEDLNTVTSDNLDPVEQLEQLTKQKAEEIPESVLDSFQKHVNQIEDSLEEIQIESQMVNKEVRSAQENQNEVRHDLAVDQNLQNDEKKIEKQIQDVVTTLQQVNNVKQDSLVLNQEESDLLSESGQFF